MRLLYDLTRGVVVETTAGTWTGGLFYSDKIHYENNDEDTTDYNKSAQPLLNELSTIYVIGIAAGVIRMALAVIHSLGHILAGALTWNKGHLVHVAKGGSEFLRGFIEAIPIIGRLFANQYYQTGYWWLIKIYNPKHPDSLDKLSDNWQFLKDNRPSGYFVC